MNKKKELLKLLVKEKIISEKQVSEIENIIENSDKKIDDVIREQKMADLEEFTKVKSNFYNLPYKSLIGVKIGQKVLEIISPEVAENYQIICFEKKDTKIKIGIIEPDNYKAMEAVSFLAKEENLEVSYYLISKISFLKVLKQYKNLEKEVDTALKMKENDEKKETVESKEKISEMDQIIKSAPVSKIVSVIITHAVDGKASDIHIEPSVKESRVRYRIDGILHTSLVLPINVHSAIVARIKVLASLKLDETRIPQDGRIRLSINKKNVDFRVSILPLTGKEKIVMRILDTSKQAPKLEELGYSGRALRVINENINKSSGMFLVTGPTGSGKSTTLFSVLNMLNKEEVNISTLEDPVEYFITGVNQSQVRPKVNFTFSSGLRSLLRQDPDIIMVGEIRDNETAELAIHAALTGHFVLSTLHTNSAVGTIPRFLDMEVEPFLLGSTLNIIIAQRLARRICPHCKKEYKLPEKVLKNIEKEILKVPERVLKEEIKNFKGVEKIKFYKGEGCPRCGKSGYSGRVAISEVFDINDKIKEIIMDENKNLVSEDVVKTQDFITFTQDGMIKAMQGITTMEEITRVTKE